MQSTTAKNIFISYRRQDTPGETGRLADALSQHFREDQIFRDIERLEPGADFVDEIGKRLQTCEVMLAVIGPDWLGIRDGQPSRIQEPNDWVSIELATALKRNIRVVPILVNGGKLPLPEELPTELQPLLRRHTYEISEKRWKYDTDQLINFLIQSVGLTPKPTEKKKAAIKKPLFKRKAFWVIFSGLILATVLFFITTGKDTRTSAASYPAYKDSILGTWAATFFEPTGSSRRKEIITYSDGGHLSGTVNILSEIDTLGMYEKITIAYDISFVGTWSIRQDEITQTFDKVEVIPSNELAFKMKSQNPKGWKNVVAEWMQLEVRAKTYHIYEINKNEMTIGNNVGSTLEYKKKL